MFTFRFLAPGHVSSTLLPSRSQRATNLGVYQTVFFSAEVEADCGMRLYGVVFYGQALWCNPFGYWGTVVGCVEEVRRVCWNPRLAGKQNSENSKPLGVCQLIF
jgi:hypothetical protein